MVLHPIRASPIKAIKIVILAIVTLLYEANFIAAHPVFLVSTR
jgi:hypothetical protein